MNAASVWQLTKIDLFSDVDEEELCTALGNGASVKKLPRRRAVPLEEGSGWVWGLSDGLAKLCRPQASGRRNVEGLLRSGDLFGRLGDGPRQPLVIETITSCTLVTLPAQGLRKYLTSRPDLMLTVLQILEDSQRRLQRRVESLVFKDVYTRVTETILQLAVDIPDTCPYGGMAIDIRINQSDMAELVGSSRQAVNRVLRDLEQRHLLHRHGKVYCIPDLRRIRQKLDSETLAVEG